MRTVSVLLSVTAMALAMPVSGDPPTREQVLAAARQAALEAQSRYYLVRIAQLTREFDPQQALNDYQAAADMPRGPNVVGGWALDADWEVAKGLTELGDLERALELLRSGIDNLEPARPGPTDDIGGAYTIRIMALSRSAELLHPLDPAKADQALSLAAETIEEAEKFRGGGWWTGKEYTRGPYLAALALKDPEEAYEQAKASTASRRPRVSIRLVLNMLEADSATVIARLDEIMQPGLLVFRHPYSPGLIVSRLAATIFPDDPRQALDLAVKHKLDKAPDIKALPPLGPLVEAVQEAGPEGLPRDEKYAALYIRLTRDLARADYEMAMELALSLEKPKDRAEAVSEICEALADTDLPHALEAAAKLIELWETVGKCPDSALERAASALAPYDDETVPQLLRRLRQGWSIMEPFPRWWRNRRQAAATWLPELPDWLQYFGTVAVLENCADTLSIEEGRALAEQVLKSPLFGKDERTTWWVLKETAAFAADLAQEAWQKLEPLDTAQAKENQLRMRLDALLPIALAFEGQEAGTSGLEVAEIGRLLTAAPEDARWRLLYQGRLAHIYAHYDGPRAKATAEQILEALRDPWQGAAAVEPWSEAVAALARVDAEAGKQVMLETAQLWRTQDDFRTKLFRTTVSKVARWRPELLIEFAQSAPRMEGLPTSWYWPNILVSVAEEGLDEAVMMVIKAWLKQAEDKAEAAQHAVAGLRDSPTAQLVPMVLEFLASLEEGLPLADALGQAGWRLALASDEQLDRLLARVQAFGAEVSADIQSPAMQKVVAAKAARDWEGSQELLASLQPDEPRQRARVALMIVEMMQKTGRMGGPAADD